MASWTGVLPDDKPVAKAAKSARKLAAAARVEAELAAHMARHELDEWDLHDMRRKAGIR